MMRNDQGFARLRFAAALACMAFSGGAALLYQIVWMRELAIAIGTAQSAVAITLAVFMGGLALGGAISARLLPQIVRPGRWYAILETIIGFWALAVPLLFGLAHTVMLAVLGHSADLPPDTGVGQTMVYAATAGMIFAVPTLAMGATLPLLIATRAPDRNSADRAVVWFYATNTIGAAVGAVATGFVLVPRLGLGATLWVGAALNLTAAILAAWQLSVRKSDETHMMSSHAGPQVGIPWSTALAACLIGIATFSLETLWARLLAHVLGGTTQGFALMLAVWLGGLALGAALAGRAIEKNRRLGGAILGGALLTILGYVALALSHGTSAGGVMLALLPGATALGATYPLLIRRAARTVAAGPAAGIILAANTAGALMGSLLCAFVFLENFGFGGTILLAGLVLVGAAFVVVEQPGLPTLAAFGLAYAAYVGLPLPGAVLDHSVVDRAPAADRIFLAVGRTATVQVQDRADGFSLRSDGLPEALVAREGAPPVLNDQQWLTALPVLARPGARAMLVVGLGGGVAIEAVPESIHKIDVVEIEGQVIAANRAIAALRARDPLRDPRLTIVHNDARNALARATRRYDIIVSQPSHPWTAGSANLYTGEFIALAKTRLVRSGVLVQWMNTAFVDDALLASFATTLRHRFRYICAYEPVRDTLIFLASDAPLAPVTGFGAMSPSSRASIAQAGITAGADLVWSLVGDQNSAWMSQHDAAEISDDLNPMAARSRAVMATPVRRFDDIGPTRSGAVDPVTAAYMAMRSGEVGRRRAQAYYAAFARPDDIAFAQASARGAVPPEMVLQSASARAVARGWELGRQGDFAGLSALDGALAAALPTDPWFALASRLRVDWRLAEIGTLSSNAPGYSEMARDAFAITDANLRQAVSSDVLMQRATLAQVLGDHAALIETSFAFADLNDGTAVSPRNRTRGAALRAALEAAPESPRGNAAITALNRISPR